jgi:putative FmdB family regulatory protein
MPIFEFVCEVCGNDFEELVFSSSTASVRCPACESQQVKKKISTFATKAPSGKSTSSWGGSSASSSCSTGSL